MLDPTVSPCRPSGSAGVLRSRLFWTLFLGSLAATLAPRGALAAPSAADIRREADYILSCQFLSPGHPAHGAINNVYGAPTWVSPRENALAILGLLRAADVLEDDRYRERASLAGDYLISIQEADGAWANQYDHATVSDGAKPPNQTAEVLLALYALGGSTQRYQAAIRGASYLLAAADPARKGGPDDGLLGGGRDASGNWNRWRWTSDNAWAYQALQVAGCWAERRGDSALAGSFLAAASAVRAGINRYLRDPTTGLWHRAVDEGHRPQNPERDWINYAPQMVDVPALGTGTAAAGEWIHTVLQHPSGGLRTDTGALRDRLSPGYSFQASLCWLDLGQEEYAAQAWEWVVASSLWQRAADANGVRGGFVDWVEGERRAAFWERFIDTSFYAIATWTGGYDFTLGCVPFVRGDANGDGGADLADAVRILRHLFAGAALGCEKAADTDDSGTLHLADPVLLLGFLFRGGSPPTPPYPQAGADWTPDGLSCAASEPENSPALRRR